MKGCWSRRSIRRNILKKCWFRDIFSLCVQWEGGEGEEGWGSGSRIRDQRERIKAKIQKRQKAEGSRGEGGAGRGKGKGGKHRELIRDQKGALLQNVFGFFGFALSVSWLCVSLDVSVWSCKGVARSERVTIGRPSFYNRQ